MTETPVATTVHPIWIVEDHMVFAKQLQRLLDQEPDMECTQSFRDAAELYEKLRFTRDRPELLLLDLSLPRKNGLEILTEVRAAVPGMKVVVLTASDDREKVYRAICNGASGYILKSSAPSEIIDGIRAVLHGAPALSAPVASMILEGFAKHGPVEEIEPLTSREESVLRYLVKGMIKKEIADQLAISQHTVDMHLRSVYRKLHVRSQTEAVSKALRQGLV
jgi:DNA-binding NarL/FixJ family response regulator